MWTGAKNLAPIRTRSVDGPVRSESLYRLHYSADCVPFRGHAIVDWPVLNLSGLAVVHAVYVRSKGELGIVLFRPSVGYHRPLLLQRLAPSHLLENFTGQKLKKKDPRKHFILFMHCGFEYYNLFRITNSHSSPKPINQSQAFQRFIHVTSEYDVFVNMCLEYCIVIIRLSFINCCCFI